ncbi:hypothetical protein HPB49_026467 [Dermacentor silvarum]|nr:hypothetical protein HPB49_026467 [Dermacentor silvarum]
MKESRYQPDHRPFYWLQGWNDVSFHGSRQIPTPNIDALAANGVVLQRHYSTPVCTPSRSAFFTSRYPPRTELGYGALPTAGKGALPLRFEVLPQWLKRLGYSTHMVGKRKTGHFATAAACKDYLLNTAH